MTHLGKQVLGFGLAIVLGTAIGPATMAASLPGGSVSQLSAMLLGGWTTQVQGGQVVSVPMAGALVPWAGSTGWIGSSTTTTFTSGSTWATGGSSTSALSLLDGFGIPPVPLYTRSAGSSPSTGSESTPPLTTVTPHAPSGTSTSPDIATVLSLVNQQRALVDSAPLTLDPVLSHLAQERANVLSADHILTHDVPGYGLPAGMETADGVTGILIGGEDLSTGNTLQQAFSMLVTSPWHLANMQLAAYNTVGIAIAHQSNGTSAGIVVLDILFIER